MEDKTLEEKAAETILQKAAKINIGGKEYEAAHPSIATLILVSEAVSRLPKRALDSKNLVQECLSVAKDCRVLGDIAAILILGARHINDRENTPQTGRKKRLWGLFGSKVKADTGRTAKERLSQEILETMTPSDLYGTIAMLLQRMDLGDFFGLTTFLSEVNLLRQTKVENPTTAFGQ